MTHDQAERLRLIADGQARFARGGALTRPLKARRRPTRTIAIASGKGGVGKTNVCVNLGLALAKLGRAVTIIDMDLGLGNIDVILGVDARLTLEEVVAGRCSLSEALIEGPYGTRLVCAGSGVVALANLEPEQREHLIARLSVIDDSSDIVLLDIGAGISPNVIDFIAAAGEVIVVTTTEPAAMTDAYALIKVTHHQARDVAFSLLVNQVVNPREAREVAQAMVSAARRFLDVDLATLGFLPHDDKLLSAIKRQVPVLVSYPTSRFATTIEDVAGRLCLPAPMAEEDAASGFVRFLRRLRGRVA
jgi:flagellar biosynthesis protein FlhG